VVEEKTNTAEMQFSQEIIANLRPTEKVIWSDKPLFHPITAFTFTTGNPGSLVAIVLFFSIFPIILLPIFLAGGEDLPFFLLFCGVMSGIFAFPFIAIYAVNLLTLKNTEYALTNQRIIIVRGFFSRYLRFIDLDKICI
jgi:uncharacterized membrane protein YdbT with pleckstrin-like domain